MLPKDKNGVGGFFEDIPSMMVITISITVFMISAIYSYGIYMNSIEEADFSNDAYEIMQHIRSYDKLLINGTYTGEPTEGRFDYYKLNEMTTKQLQTDFSRQYKYNIIVVDLEPTKEQTKSSWKFGEETPSGKVSKNNFETTITIKIRDNEFHLGILKVEVWK